MRATREDIITWLEEVKDPEIPVLSLVDLGVIGELELNENSVRIELLPTFVGCPAIEMMKTDIITTLAKRGIENVQIEVSFRKPWTSDRISEKGRLAIQQFGIAPPVPTQLLEDLEILETATCPRCGETNTELRSSFGSTLCRSIYYCNTCRESFEQFKAI